MKPLTILILSLTASFLSTSVMSASVDTNVASATMSANVEEVKVAADPYEGFNITVNINTGSLEELSTLLLGVGEKKAQLIIDYREMHGAFESAEALMKVKGIGPSIIEKNQNRIML